ncbi:CRISPR-associated protein, Cmr5 family [Anaerolinea thermolimosa]|uniref:CRISPR type III-B/RAMP module-associated protein Cmr5 n=1 Tax=Anaerolinea thermolimosa TaxID=229919 RepID=A0A7U9KMH3_9CHLR|nr:type III-B CRISPR module-associated protein Cmr5 [Anaerolinea thermolimosa]GAP08579.1 CRISPR-associated protein, Cmr5 family [Anaerolinea thermolimosa]
MAETVTEQRSLEQKRASHAYDAISRARQKGVKDLKSLARNAPASIQSNGLGQTLAFWKAKKEVHHLTLYNDLSGWLKKQLHIDENRDLLEWIATTASSLHYRQATAEALAYLNWYKRFAEAELPDSTKE